MKNNEISLGGSTAWVIAMTHPRHLRERKKYRREFFTRPSYGGTERTDSVMGLEGRAVAALAVGGLLDLLRQQDARFKR